MNATEAAALAHLIGRKTWAAADLPAWIGEDAELMRRLCEGWFVKGQVSKAGRAALAAWEPTKADFMAEVRRVLDSLKCNPGLLREKIPGWRLGLNVHGVNLIAERCRVGLGADGAARPLFTLEEVGEPVTERALTVSWPDPARRPLRIVTWSRDFSAIQQETIDLLRECLEAWIAAVGDAKPPAQTVGAHDSHRTEVVLWEGAAHTDRNIRLARTRTAFLEAHGDVAKARAALEADGNGVGRSTFYDHLQTLDTELGLGWRSQLMVSGASGNPENGVRIGTRGKSRAKLS